MDETAVSPTASNRAQRAVSRVSKRVRRGPFLRWSKRACDKVVLFLEGTLPLARAVKKFLVEWGGAVRPLAKLALVAGVVARIFSHFF